MGLVKYNIDGMFFIMPEGGSFKILYNNLPPRLRNSEELIILDFGEFGTIRLDELRKRAGETINKLYLYDY